ncbi:LicD family protein [Salinibacterium sp. SWN1162]|uniref:LicD family protein n=1 Tax=Salinibacterium sp. SWN1162 TaxID=2792053 RepID=UPI0018CF927F|nr:LicD family protein [Salinibacterium sp. SWN1162]MBH0008736.1 LicD family protein [Salinibacterium sp. SWN1162]
MTTPLTASRRKLRFEAQGSGQAVDIRFDGHRVWSTELVATADSHKIALDWPPALRPYLSGTTKLEVADSGSGEILASGAVRFGLNSKPVSVRDAEGRLLSINKWGRLGVSVAGVDTSFRERLIAHTHEILDHLAELGYTAYITGGTLLGAVRDGDILPHDDDTDLGVLLDHSDPADISLASYRMQRELEELGYDVVRHSTAHLQLTYFTENGSIDHYVDIFTAFYRSADEFCQPIHVRGNLPIESLLPLVPIEFAGISMPGPANPEAWLEICYGPAWSIPNPSFAFVTPMNTRRRFENWFGSQNTNRVFWESRHTAGSTSAAADARSHRRELDTVLATLPPGSSLVDVGTGDGADAITISNAGHHVIGFDYSYKALSRAHARAETEAKNSHAVEFRYLNIYDRRDLLTFGAELVTQGTSWHFNATNVLAGLTKEGRANYFLFLKLVMNPDSLAIATFDTNYSVTHFRGDNPLTWHYPLDWLHSEIAPHGLTAELLHTATRRTAHGRRRTATVVIRRSHPSHTEPEAASWNA